MIGFHIDMNVAQFSGEYLEKWLRELARLGYDTIVWEVENNVQWESCPECVSPDAFTKAEFRRLLRLCAELRLESIPLFQTLGHCEYVLKHPAYRHLAERSDRIDQYCPLHPELVPFLKRWIDEYMELFGPVNRFHLGADEAWTLGHCDRCRSYATARTLSELYIQHVNAVAGHLLDRRIQPAIWADMVLHYPQALEKLSRSILLFDWMYDIHRGDGQIWVWSDDKGLRRRETLAADTLERFGRFLYPHGEEPGRDPETFYTADYLAAQGFSVVTCPGSSSFGDNVFSPRMHYHLANTADSFAKGTSGSLEGSVLTSWTVHLFPYELQRPCIELAAFVRQHPGEGLDLFQRRYEQRHFGIDDPSFFTACGLLSKSCLFTYTASLGVGKDCLGPAPDHVATTLGRLRREEKLEHELNNCCLRLNEYSEALDRFEQLEAGGPRGQAELEHWRLAARNLVCRAASSIYLLRGEIAMTSRLPLASSFTDEAQSLLADMRQLRNETDHMYRGMLKPTRRVEVIDWLFDGVQRALSDRFVGIDSAECRRAE